MSTRASQESSSSSFSSSMRRHCYRFRSTIALAISKARKRPNVSWVSIQSSRQRRPKQQHHQELGQQKEQHRRRRRGSRHTMKLLLAQGGANPNNGIKCFGQYQHQSLPSDHTTTEASSGILTQAIRQRNAEAVRLLLEYGANADIPVQWSSKRRGGIVTATPLLFAFDDYQTLQFSSIYQALLEHGAQVNATDSHGESALWKVVQWHVWEESRQQPSRISSSAEPSWSSTMRNTDNPSTTMSVSVSSTGITDTKSNHNPLYQLMVLLLQYGADPDCSDHECGETPLSMAVQRGAYMVVQLLLDYYIINPTNSSTTTTTSAATKHGTYTCCFDNSKQDWHSIDTKTGTTTTNIANHINTGNKGGADDILCYNYHEDVNDRGGNVRQEGFGQQQQQHLQPSSSQSKLLGRLLHLAVQRKRLEIVQLLLSYGADIEEIIPLPPEHYFLLDTKMRGTGATGNRSGRIQNTRDFLLLQHGVGQQSVTPLRMAILLRWEEGIELLLQSGASVGAMTKWQLNQHRIRSMTSTTSSTTFVDYLVGDTALHWAIRMGHLPAVRLLLSYGAVDCYQIRNGGGNIDKYDGERKQMLLRDRLTPLEMACGYIRSCESSASRMLSARTTTTTEAAVHKNDSTTAQHQLDIIYTLLVSNPVFRSIL